jgi:hypothetical protein
LEYGYGFSWLDPEQFEVCGGGSSAPMVGASDGGLVHDNLRNKACFILIRFVLPLLLLLMADHGGDGKEESMPAWARSRGRRGCSAFLVLWWH